KEGTTFGFVQSNLGILPGWGGGAILYKKVAPTFAFNWLTKGAIYGAAYLHEKRWIHKIAHDEQWHDLEKLLQPYIHKTYEQMQYLKAQYNEMVGTSDLYESMDLESQRAAKLWPSE